VDRIVQALIIGGIVAVIGGSLAWEFYVEPWLRRRRVRRIHRHAGLVLPAYRRLYAEARAQRRRRALREVLVQFDTEDDAIQPVACGENN
jgi:hypothetical protein